MRGKSANLPAITEKDWDDINFGVEMGLDYYALSFVRNAEVIYELKRYLSKRGRRPPAELPGRNCIADRMPRPVPVLAAVAPPAST